MYILYVISMESNDFYMCDDEEATSLSVETQNFASLLHRPRECRLRK